MLDSKNVRFVMGSGLVEGDMLVGEFGGLTRILDVEPINVTLNFFVAKTEHGPLYLDPGQQYGITRAPVGANHFYLM